MSETTVSTFDATTGEHLTTETIPALAAPVLDVAALADELLAQRARLDAAEDALDHLIVASLEEDL